MKKGALLQISAIETKTGEYGDSEPARYATIQKNGARIDGCVGLSQNVTQLMELVPLCMLLYDGMKLGKQRRRFTMCMPYALPLLQTFADELRGMLTSALMNFFQPQTLDKFASGTVFVFKDVRRRKLRKDGDDALTVSFETTLDNGLLTGTLIVLVGMEAEI